MFALAGLIYLPYPRANPTSVCVGQGLQPGLLTDADPAVLWARTVETLRVRRPGRGTAG
ncbi:MAG: hypothetical protein U0802_19145 [Candidatus Binatia bacterium]